MGKKSLQLQQLNSKILGFASLKQVAIPPTGWIKAIRTTIGMSMQQLGNKLNVSKQGILDIEKREKRWVHHHQIAERNSSGIGYAIGIWLCSK